LYVYVFVMCTGVRLCAFAFLNVRDGWSSAQHTLFDKIISVLEDDVLARLAFAGEANEPVMRRLHNDKTAKKVRRILGDIAWDETLCQWLHGTLSDNLSSKLLGVYLDVLQVLRSKIPSLVDMMTSLSGSMLPASSEALALLLKRPWDPAIALSVNSKQRKLTGSPFLVLIPSTPTSPSVPSTRRSRAWHNQLATLGRVVPVGVLSSVYHEGAGVTPDECAEKMIYVTQCKVQELQGHFSSRPVVLIGWGAGALVACKVSQMEDVTAIVCLGFPTMGPGGSKDVSCLVLLFPCYWYGDIWMVC
jgi:regulatory NSL complex subunit 3